jgi:hypothetical protein
MRESPLLRRYMRECRMRRDSTTNGSARFMRERTKNKYKRYITAAIEISTGIVFWSAVVVMVYACALSRGLYERDNPT